VEIIGDNIVMSKGADSNMGWVGYGELWGNYGGSRRTYGKIMAEVGGHNEKL
jgi:hypothetical protein